MAERPILFSGPMVRAILEGRKTQTRRVVKPQPPQHAGDGYPRNRVFCNLADSEEDILYAFGPDGWNVLCPYGVTGDRLWVREAWAVDAPLEEVRREREDMMGPSGLGHGPYFRADPVHENTGLTWRPSIHMPRWACRLVLEVTDVRVERLQEISEDNAKAEGVSLLPGTPAESTSGHIGAFCWLWQSLNRKRAPWASNPWVWVVEFKRA